MRAKALVDRLVSPIVDAANAARPRETYISAGCRFEGRVIISGPGALAGLVEGGVACDDALTIEAQSIVNGDVSARKVIVRGRVIGPIVGGESVIIASGAVCEGDIHAPAVTVEHGARFNGKIIMPANDTAPASAESAKPAAPAEPLWAAAE
jgi:cytoskeletal protein CcmA (bactofilin family)